VTQLPQVASLLADIELSLRRLPLILAGDLNSLPESAVCVTSTSQSSKASEQHLWHQITLPPPGTPCLTTRPSTHATLKSRTISSASWTQVRRVVKRSVFM
jgi:endonuclease/exonuclease/phosphatase family metal-dependent hydrolase